MILWRLIKAIIKYTWKTINLIREIIFNTLLLIIVISIFGIFNSMNNLIPQNGILVVDIEGEIVDSTANNGNFYKLSRQLSNDSPNLDRQNSLFQLVQKIEQATYDSNIHGMVLKLDNFVGADLPSLQYLTKYLIAFKEANKPIYAIGSQFNQKQYYLASIADQIYLIKQGAVSLYGFSANNLYFKSLLDHLKISTHVFRVGTYKSAIEPFIRDDMSPAAKENTTRWLTSMWNHYLADISSNRKLASDILVPEPKVMLSRIKEASGSMSDYALIHNIVDQVYSSSQAEKMISRQFNYQPQLSIYDYQLAPSNMKKNSKTNDRIAVIFIDGVITSEATDYSSANSHDIVKQLREIAEDSSTKAVVIRINSPGGGVYGSELIRSEIEELRENRNIPVVVSMGGMAASGGYWIATESDHIIADKDTLTGSIGIFGVISTFENSLAHIGVYSDGVSTSPLANSNVTENLSDELNQLIQINIENGYHTFLSLVANARNMTYEEVDNIAQGQVWLGEEAKQFGLVDELGDFDLAIDTAAKLAGISEYSIEWKESENSFLDTFLSDYSAILPKSTIEMIYNRLPIAHQIQKNIQFWDSLNDPQNRYAYCLNCADIK